MKIIKYIVCLAMIVGFVGIASKANAQCHFAASELKEGVEVCRPMNPQEIVTINNDCARGQLDKLIITGEYKLGGQEFCVYDPDTGRFYCEIVPLDCCCNVHGLIQ
jgi:hypothetical protein